MTGHDLIVIPILPELLAAGVTVWRCVRCDHTVTVRTTPQGTVWYRVAIVGDRDADHTGALWLAVDQATRPMPLLTTGVAADAAGESGA